MAVVSGFRILERVRPLRAAARRSEARSQHAVMADEAKPLALEHPRNPASNVTLVRSSGGAALADSPLNSFLPFREHRVSLTLTEVRRLFQVPIRGRVRLSDYDPSWGETHVKNLSEAEFTIRSEAFLHRSLTALAHGQQRLSASDTQSVLIVLHGSAAGGIDSIITHVMSGVNPQGCQMVSFTKPSCEDLDQNFLWRYMKALPERGRIGIFNGSYYDNVLVVRLLPELAHVRGADPNGALWRQRYDDINAFERDLRRNGTLILKFFLNVSQKEQRRRFLERLDQPEPHWKCSVSDLEERKHWSKYQDAFEQMLQHTSTTWAPWWVIPADRRWVTHALVLSIIARSIDRLRVRFPHTARTHAEDSGRVAFPHSSLSP